MFIDKYTVETRTKVRRLKCSEGSHVDDHLRTFPKYSTLYVSNESRYVSTRNHAPLGKHLPNIARKLAPNIRLRIEIAAWSDTGFAAETVNAIGGYVSSKPVQV
ncbi:hypothetical protein X777_04970 [Ooceraea biroi]|uniref:Uncharacterized protein n=1 Tax=Ooceraea biroi TaxID=2015173 RepID=A0A026WEZ9_OOCBI|nr:hypothetical protein X777_04970 [Ooceraea biroi]